MEKQLNWELYILSKAVAYRNLTGAAAQVGVSQPQLSRIIARLEATYDLKILDRESKRNSVWTRDGIRLVETYTKLIQQFSVEVDAISEQGDLKTMRVGTLDGLISESLKFCDHLLTHTNCQTLELVVGDLGFLEEQYYKNSLEFLFTSRIPSNRKHAKNKIIGYQTLDLKGAGVDIQVLSSFEYASTHAVKRRTKQRLFVSNSLVARERWIAEYTGKGFLPSSVKKRTRPLAGYVPVFLIGLEHLAERYWNLVNSASFS